MAQTDLPDTPWTDRVLDICQEQFKQWIRTEAHRAYQLLPSQISTPKHPGKSLTSIRFYN